MTDPEQRFSRQLADRVSPGIAIVVTALVITSVLVIFDVVTRPSSGGSGSPQGEFLRGPFGSNRRNVNHEPARR